MPVENDIEQGRNVLNGARAFRIATRWRKATDDPERAAAIEAYLQMIDEAMKPIRAQVGRIRFHEDAAEVADDLRAVSSGLQYERRQLKKMRRAA